MASGWLTTLMNVYYCYKKLGVVEVSVTSLRVAGKFPRAANLSCLVKAAPGCSVVASGSMPS